MADFRKNFLARVDWITVIIYLVFIAFGWLNIYATNYQEGQELGLFSMLSRHSKQFVYILAALILAIVVLIIDSKFWVLFAYPVYGVVVFFLVLVLFLGREINGATSWFFIGSFSIQPSEFAKIGAVLIVAKILSQFNFSVHNWRNMTLLFGAMLLPSVLILLQNDTGSAIVYFALILVVFREGLNETFLIFGVIGIFLFLMTLLIPFSVLVPLVSLSALIIVSLKEASFRVLLFGALIQVLMFVALIGVSLLGNLELNAEQLVGFAAIASLPVYLWIIWQKRLRSLFVILSVWAVSLLLIASVDYLFNEVMEDHQRSRINQILGFESDPLGRGYNLNQSKIAIGSGGLTGKGFLKGTQTRFNFVPEQTTDFIYCTVGEEWGFAGSSFVILVFVGFLLRLLYLAERQRSVFSRVFGYGVFSIFFFHFFINIGMTIGLVPVIGIPLPFFSYGGSSLWSFTFLLFIFLHLDTDRFDVVA
ncbi:MAG: rod shape-determining protein RodA [Bacteroidales bacterium]|nr:rod shape-determining protein RodA [Bacteroidales bacterium]